jgi:hypothetical protein
MGNMNNENVEVVEEKKLNWLKPVLLSVGSFILGATLMAWLGGRQESDETATIDSGEIVDDYDDYDNSENLEEEA